MRIVQVLQQTILEAHLLFFKAVPADAATQGAPLAELVRALRPTGLLALHQLALAQELVQQLRATLSQHAVAPWSSDDVSLNLSALDAGELKAPGQPELKRVFDKWLAEAIRAVADKSRGVLSAMQSAARVARLQQRVFQSSTTVVPGGPYAQRDWAAASFDLLASARLRARLEKERDGAPEDRPKDGADDPTKLLWATALRAPFLLQVERLLRRSCQEVIMRAREQLLLALEAEGLAVDSFSLTVTVPSAPASAAVSSSSSSSSSSSISSSSSPSAATSSRLFRRAEGVRARLEEDLLDLLADTVQHPSRHGAALEAGAPGTGSNDPQSSAALSRAFYVQCSQLMGQLMVALRTLTASVAAGLEARHAVRAKAPEQHDPRAFAALSSGLLLLGRLAWLLKVRGRFLEDALASHGLGADKSGNTQAQLGAARYDLSSEDQVRSAFEIADTDGDGVVTYSEAVEAVQALAVSDPEDSLLGSSAAGAVTSATPFLSMLLTPSLTFTELAMLCAHLLTPDSCRPADRLRACIEDLVTLAHAKWSERTVADLGVALAVEVAAELGPGGHAHIRTFWRPHWVDMDETQREQMLVPAACSGALTNFLLGANQRAAAYLMSIDTSQVLPPAPEVDACGGAGGVDRLSSLVLGQLHGLAVASAVAHYAALLKAPQAADCMGSTRASKLAQLRAEDCALQAVFDLLVVEAVAERCRVTAPSGLKACQAGWRARLDPINAELFAPLLRVAAALFATRTFLLFPGLCTLPAPVAAPATRGPGHEEDAVAGIFAPTQPCRFSLLPLAMATHSHLGHSERKAGQDAVETRDAAARQAQRGVGGGKGKVPAEGLGKSILTGLGNILGGGGGKAAE